MKVTKDEIIIEFMTKFQGRAYDNKFGVCFLCGGGREIVEGEIFKPRHLDTCLFSRAEKLVLKQEGEPIKCACHSS